MTTIKEYKKIHPQFKLNGIHYDLEALDEVAYSLIKEGEPHEKKIGEFLLHWLDDQDHIAVNTSGSTGDPKVISLSKQAMVNSAKATNDYFKMEPGIHALLCLSARYIAGKMMLVRAIVNGWELDYVLPAAYVMPFNNKHYDFVAMVPMQLYESRHILDKVRTILIGGAAVDSKFIESLENADLRIFESYGMTETASHIAVKDLLSANPVFICLPEISCELDERGCLVINAPSIHDGPLVTNDVADLLSDTSFKWLGRIDNVINSGGIKIHPEQLEKKLEGQLDCRFLISSLPDDKLGERIILIVEAESAAIPDNAYDALEAFEKPKDVFAVSKFILTESGKIQRGPTLALLN